MAEKQLSVLDNPHDAELAPSRLPRIVQVAGLVLFVAVLLLSAVFAITDTGGVRPFCLGRR